MKYVNICILLLLFGVTGNSQTNSRPDGNNSTDPQISLSITALESGQKETKFRFQLQNSSERPILFLSNPVLQNGTRSYYISEDNSGKSVLKVESRVYMPGTLPYSDQTSVEVKRLDTGEQSTGTITLRWPLFETVPPIPFHFNRKRIERNSIDKLCFTIGYFIEDDSILNYLKGKHFGWYIRGSENILPGRSGPRFYEIQKLVSTTIDLHSGKVSGL